MKLRKITVALLALSLTLPPLANVSTVEAAENPMEGIVYNPIIINYGPDSVRTQDNGSNYWPTASIREWLNAEGAAVQYTNEPPSYKNEVGFLNEFTREEQSAIAITERKVHIGGQYGAVALDGGSGTVGYYDGLVPTPFIQVGVPNIQKQWKTIRYQIAKDKVFMLATHEMYEYVQKRGWDFKKKLTEAERKRINQTDPYYAYLMSTSNPHNYLWGISASGKLEIPSGGQNKGIVPAIHLKPNYVLSDGKRGSDLKIGDKVIFGKYSGVPIEWKVVNITDGYPLLWSEQIQTIKKFDEPGSTHYRNSNYVVYGNGEVSIVNDLKYVNQNGSSDVTEPTLKVVNESDLLSRRNDSFTLIIEAKDEEGGSGIDYVLLPNGSKDYRTMVTYEITENGRYEFVAVDKAGNHYGFMVPVGNISPPPSILIKSSANAWTNKDVTIDIETSLNQYTDWSVSSVQTNSAGKGSGKFSDFTSYAGKKYQISGKVKLVSATGQYDNAAAARIWMRHDYITNNGGIYYTATTWPVPFSVPITTLKNLNGQYYEFNTTYTVPNNYFGNLTAHLFVLTKDNNNGVDYNKYTVEWKDIKFEFLDKEAIYIEKIVLPNGTEITGQNQYSEIISTPGNYTYKVYDSRGKLTEKTFTVKIDRVNPTATHTLTPNTFTNQTVNIRVVGADALSGVKRVQKPNGEWVNGTTVDYYVSANGVYNFKIEDQAGNVIDYPVTVNTIDKQGTTTSFSPKERDWGIDEINVGIAITDAGGSGVKEYRYAWSESKTKPTEGWSGWYQSSNGVIKHKDGGIWYLHIETIDRAGNVTHQYSGEYRMIKQGETPMVTINVFPQPTGNWVNKFINLYVNENKDFETPMNIIRKYEITSTPTLPTTFTKTLPNNGQILLNQVGEKYVHMQYTLQNGQRITKTVGPYLIDTANIGEYEAKIVDASGNAVTNWTNKDVYVSIGNPSGTASLSGLIKQYRIENYHTSWQPYVANTKIFLEGDQRVLVQITNNAGTVSTMKVLTSKMDKTLPQVNAVTLKGETDSTYSVVVNTTDALSGVKEVKLNNGVVVTSTNQLYTKNQLTTKPTNFTVTDRAGNTTTAVTFAAEPVVTFKSPYTPSLSAYRGNVEATLSGTGMLKLQVGNRTYDCITVPCAYTITRNTTLIATAEDGNKITKKSIVLSNIDNSILNLILQGQRDRTNEKKITFKWTYNLANAKLTCLEGGVSKTFNVTGKEYILTTAKNTIYDCTLSGNYSTEAIVSNRIVVYPDQSKPIEGGNANGQGTQIKTNGSIYVEESRIGETYIIGGKNGNAGNDPYVPVPTGVFK